MPAASRRHVLPLRDRRDTPAEETRPMTTPETPPEPTETPDSAWMVPSRPPVHGRIVFDLATLAIARGAIVRHGPFQGQPNLTMLMRGTGLSQTTIFPLLRQPETVKGIQLETLARICEFLRCQPGDIMRYEVTPEHPQTSISDRYKKDPGR